jgi:hypothetical protein
MKNILENDHKFNSLVLNLTTLTIELTDQVVAAMRYDPAQFAREMRLVAAATWYEQGKISQKWPPRLPGWTVPISCYPGGYGQGVFPG